LGDRHDSRLLDLACGTGRVSVMALEQDWFQGRVDAIDLSPNMLSQLRARLARFGQSASDRVSVQHQDLSAWKAPANGRYDTVAFMEASEFVPQFPRLAAEIARALVPGGLFLLTKVNASQSWLFFGRHQSANAMTSVLQQAGFERIECLPWRRRYDVIHAWKPR
jgi:cyclopropane fatty-acyl-phospholipid synthase-like methyltransferase